MIAIKRILVATDFSEASVAALLYAKDFARAYSARLDVLHVVDHLATLPDSPMGSVPNIARRQTELEANARRTLDRLLTGEERRSLRARGVVLTSSNAADEIVSYARDAQIDLIIMGAHGKTSIALFFMGSVAQHVLRSAPCPVLTVRHPERERLRFDAPPPERVAAL